MEIVFCTDNNYVMPCGITMVSLFENNKGEDITIHLLGTDLTESNKLTLKEITDKYKAKIVFYDVKEEYLANYNLMAYDGPGHISISCYTRLFMDKFLPLDVDKVLYLDCDLLILDNLRGLWNINVDNYSLGGVIDSYVFYTSTQVYRRLKYPEKWGYINSGVLLINLKYWREHNTLAKMLDYARTNAERIRAKDQDIINGALYDSILKLPIRYNMHNFFYRNDCDYLQYKEEVAAALKNPAIIHFITSMKPWLKGCVHSMAGKYLEYKELSPWKDVPVTWGNLTVKRKLRYYKRFILDALGIKKHKFRI
jgi:lipopolysaccharide biosynthesis glycosyltransferase